MCNPLVALAAAAVSTAVGVVGQIQQSKAMASAINYQSEVQGEEIRRKATAEMFDRSIETMQRIGLQRVTGAERGLNDASRTLELANDAILFDYNFDNARTMQNAESEQKARLAETNAKLAQASRPTLLGAGLQIAASGLGAYANAGGFKKAD